MRDTWFCKNCSFRELRQVFSVIEHDGTNGVCLGCGTQVVRYQCTNDIFHQAWFPLAEALVFLSCPTCGSALKELEKVDESDAPQWQKDLANLAAGVIIGTVGAAILDSLSRRN